MKIIEWEEKFSVGIKEIDDQHKVLVEILDELYYAMLKKVKPSLMILKTGN